MYPRLLSISCLIGIKTYFTLFALLQAWLLLNGTRVCWIKWWDRRLWEEHAPRSFIAALWGIIKVAKKCLYYNASELEGLLLVRNLNAVRVWSSLSIGLLHRNVSITVHPFFISHLLIKETLRLRIPHSGAGDFFLQIKHSDVTSRSIYSRLCLRKLFTHTNTYRLLRISIHGWTRTTKFAQRL